MDFLRRNLFMILTAVASLTGIALAAKGLSAMPQVVEELEKGKKLYDDLAKLKNRPVNPRRIEIERSRIDATRRDRESVFTDAKALTDYQLLVPDAFPNGDDNDLREFQKQYGLAMDKLFEPLIAGQPATSADIDVMRDKIVDEQYRTREKGLDSEETAAAAVAKGPPRTPAGVLTASGARNDPAARAHIAAARKIHCYTTTYRTSNQLKTTASLDFHVGLIDTGTVDAPFPEDAWAAQVGYWIQKDVIDAIVEVNEEAAQQAKDRGEERWVGMMPVKEIVSLRVSENYVLPDDDTEYDGATAEGFSAALPPGTATKVYTLRASRDTYEVMQFSVKLVMDQRDIFRLIQELTTNSFHTLLRIGYSSLPPNRSMQGKIYGSEPTVLVVMDFETIMLGEVFRPLMPPVVCEMLQESAYGLTCPEPSGEEGEG